MHEAAPRLGRGPPACPVLPAMLGLLLHHDQALLGSENTRLLATKISAPGESMQRPC